jgi:hypothetical protein
MTISVRDRGRGEALEELDDRRVVPPRRPDLGGRDPAVGRDQEGGRDPRR